MRLRSLQSAVAEVNRKRDREQVEFPTNRRLAVPALIAPIVVALSSTGSGNLFNQQRSRSVRAASEIAGLGTDPGSHPGFLYRCGRTVPTLRPWTRGSLERRYRAIGHSRVRCSPRPGRSRTWMQFG